MKPKHFNIDIQEWRDVVDATEAEIERLSALPVVPLLALRYIGGEFGAALKPVVEELPRAIHVAGHRLRWLPSERLKALLEALRAYDGKGEFGFTWEQT